MLLCVYLLLGSQMAKRFWFREMGRDMKTKQKLLKCREELNVLNFMLGAWSLATDAFQKLTQPNAVGVG